MLFINKPKDTLKHNPDYYVEYIYDSNMIKINLDQKNKFIITSIQIINTDNSLMLNQPLKQYADDLKYKDTLPILYSANQDEETIILNFYMKDFDFTKAKPLTDYIGLTNELDDFKLTLSELHTSFKYKKILEEGIFSEHF